MSQQARFTERTPRRPLACASPPGVPSRGRGAGRCWAPGQDSPTCLQAFPAPPTAAPTLAVFTPIQGMPRPLSHRGAPQRGLFFFLHVRPCPFSPLFPSPSPPASPLFLSASLPQQRLPGKGVELRPRTHPLPSSSSPGHKGPSHHPALTLPSHLLCHSPLFPLPSLSPLRSELLLNGMRLFYSSLLSLHALPGPE